MFADVSSVDEHFAVNGLTPQTRLFRNHQGRLAGNRINRIP